MHKAHLTANAQVLKAVLHRLVQLTRQDRV
jgi:hypothetical protein